MKRWILVLGSALIGLKANAQIPVPNYITVGQVNLLSNFQDKLYVNFGGPGMAYPALGGLVGFQFVPSIRYQQNPTGSNLTPLLGWQPYWRKNRLQINSCAYYSSGEWSWGFGLGYSIQAQKKAQ
ncbi:MAG: hypothetical protein ACO3GK_03745 [Bacteroidia bacterium]